MAEPTSTSPHLVAPPLSRLDRVDRACDRFEDAWATGARPEIESYLEAAPPHDRPELLRTLLALELGLRRRAGERPVPESYRSRFPGQAAAIDAVFAEGAVEADDSLGGPATILGAGFDSAALDSPPPTIGPLSGTTEAPDTDPLPVGTILGDYELLEPIGQGGMGIVYRAWQHGAGRVVALKLIRPRWLAALGDEHASEAVALFLAEARTAAALEHEHIVTVHDVGQVEGRPYFTMRCIEGRSLAEVLRGGPLPDARAVALLEPVARAVQHAHDRGVLHRDLKPANILVDGRGTPFVADFGLAKVLADPEAPGRDSSPDRAGTPSYMSPEQARGLVAVGRASDVYGLGATLYDLLTGRPPFRAASYRETLRQVRRDEPVPPRQLNPAIGRDLEAICLKCLEKDPHRRYPGAGRLAADLRRWQAGLPTEARPVSLPARALRWARRHPARVATAAAVVAVILGLSLENRRLATEVRCIAILLESTPDGATEAERDALTARKDEAARVLARSGRPDLARALRARIPHQDRPPQALEFQRARFRSDGIRRALWVEGQVPHR